MGLRLFRRTSPGRGFWLGLSKSGVSVGLMVLALAGCGGEEKGTKSAPTTTPEATTTKAPARERETDLTGFGATDEAWNEHHNEDPRFDPGSSYDPDPSLGDGVRFNDRYYGVSHGDGRVNAYSMRFPSVREAKTVILASEFPRDAKIAWFKVKDSCAQMFVRSRKVARALHGGGALVTFTSGEAGDHYESSDVSDAYLIALPGLGKGLGC